MSHFLLVVIVPDKTVDIEGEVERLLAPYDENIVVDEYDEPCYCRKFKMQDGKMVLRMSDEVEEVNPDCEECHGTGTRKTTYNPKSKWDWYRIGGRWDGEMTGKEAESEDGGFNFGDNHELLSNNVAKTSDAIIKKVIPFAIVTPEGEWIQRGKMGWWGMARDEKEIDEWVSQVVGIYRKYQDHIAVGVDCHI
jgi:hypothetical protein